MHDMQNGLQIAKVGNWSQCEWSRRVKTALSLWSLPENLHLSQGTNETQRWSSQRWSRRISLRILWEKILNGGLVDSSPALIASQGHLKSANGEMHLLPGKVSWQQRKMFSPTSTSWSWAQVLLSNWLHKVLWSWKLFVSPREKRSSWPSPAISV